MEVRTHKSALATFIITLLFVAVSFLCVFVALPSSARASDADGETFDAIGAELYYAETAGGDKTKVGEYSDFKLAVDAAVKHSAEHYDEKYFYTLEVLDDSYYDFNRLEKYSAQNMPAGLYANNDNYTAIVLVGDMDITINGNEHSVVIECSTATLIRGIRIRGNAHVVMNDLEVVTVGKSTVKGIELREGNMNIELNQVISQVSAYSYSQAFCLGGAGYVQNQSGERVITTPTIVAKNCSFGTPIAGRKINGKEVVDYFDKDGDGVADDANWPIPVNLYGIMTLVKVDLTLDNTSSCGYAALYLKPGDSSTGSRNSVINIINDSYLCGLNQLSGNSNDFGAVVLESPYVVNDNFYTYYDYDNDGIIDIDGSKNTSFFDKDGNETTIGLDYVATSNITVNVVDSTIDSTTKSDNESVKQYCFKLGTMQNTVTVSGNSVLTTDENYRDRPTNAVSNSYYGKNNVSILSGTVFKWEELPVSYIKCDAAVGDRLYATLAEAVENAENGDTVSLVRDIVTLSGVAVSGENYAAAVYVESGKNITLDLNGKTLYVSASEILVAIVNCGTLCMVNGTIERTSDIGAADGAARLGEFSTPINTVINKGELTLGDLNVIDKTANGYALMANGVSASSTAKLTVNSGSYISTGGNVLKNGAGSTVAIHGGSFESRANNGIVLVNNGDALIDGGSFKGANALVIAANEEVSAEINGGTFVGNIEINNITSPEQIVIGGGTFDITAKALILQYIADNRRLSETPTSVTVMRLAVKDGLVYTGKEYAAGVQLNELLDPNGMQITEDMTVVITKYADADGNEITPVPNVIKNVGTYTVSVSTGEGDAVQLIFVINKAELSLDGLVFSVTKIGDADAEFALESMSLIETSGKYKTTMLNTLGSFYIENGVVRVRDNAALTVGITDGIALNACTVVMSDNVQSVAGKYTAIATITVDPNYTVKAFDTGALDNRGITIANNGNGTYTVSKIWYIVEMGNWLVDDEGNDYSVGGGHVFGYSPAMTMPRLYDDVSAPDVAVDYYDSVFLSLYYDGTPVAVDFRRNMFAYYINDSMPVGDYTLVVESRSTENPFTYTYDYTVYPASADCTALDSLLKALGGDDGNGNTFTVEWDGYMHLLDETASMYFDALKQYVAELTPERKGCWLNSAYDNRYGELKITFNLDRMHNAAYYDERTLAGLEARPDSPDKYIIYYMLTAENFESFLSLDVNSDDFDSARRNYVFYVIIVRGVDIPVIGSATYTGGVLKADITGNEFFTVDEYDGFIDAGDHEITLSLIAPEYYYWKGKELGEKSCVITFNIAPAANDWIEVPDIVRWVEGNFDKNDNVFIGAAKFGTIVYVITDTDDNVIYDLSKNIDKRASMKAGTYILKATVIGNGNYNGLSEAFTIRILEKMGMPWWGILLIVIGALLLVALVIFILWKKGVFRIVTDKILLSIKTRIAVESTIASVRAAKRTEEGKKSVEAAKRKEAAEQRKAKAAEERNKPAEEKAAALEEKARLAVERSEKMKARAEALQAKAERLREKAQTATVDNVNTANEAAATAEDNSDTTHAEE